MNKKSLARKRMLVQTPFSHSTLKLEQKNPPCKTTRFSLHFLFRHDQNHYSNLTSKIMTTCEQILKDSAPIQFKFFELQKKKLGALAEKLRRLLKIGDFLFRSKCFNAPSFNS